MKINSNDVVIKNKNGKFVTIPKKKLQFDYKLGDTIEIEKNGDEFYFLPLDSANKHNDLEEFWDDEKEDDKDHYRKKANKTPNNYKGIHGWLLTFIVLTILSILLGFYNASQNQITTGNCNVLNYYYNNLCDDIKPLIGFESMMVLCISVFKIVVLINISSRKKKSINMAIAMVVASVVWSITDYLIAINLFNNHQAPTDAYFSPTMIGRMTGVLLYGIIWTSYFIKSERVRKTLTE